MPRNAPDEEGPGRGGDVGLLAGEVNVIGSSDGVDVRAEEQKVSNDVDDLLVKRERKESTSARKLFSQRGTRNRGFRVHALRRMPSDQESLSDMLSREFWG